MTDEEVYRYFPAMISEAYGGHIVDANGTDYVDMMSAWGSNILGYGYKRIADAVSAQILRYANVGMVGREWHRLHELLLRLVPCAEAIHLVKNGSDATAAAVRLARAVTGRDLVAHRGYHGVHDWYMASIGCAGVPSGHREQIITLDTLGVEQIKQVFAAHPARIACLMVDPMVWPIPDRETMSAIREIVHGEGALLIYDEVVSGFRVAVGGAQAMWNVLPDLACYGKSIANGLPLAVLVGSESLMRQVPSINYGLTFSLEAVSIVAAVETISEIADRDVCADLAQKGRRLKDAYSRMSTARGIASALVGHDCRPELHFDGSGALSPEHGKRRVIHELARSRVCSYGIFNLCYAHTERDLDTVIWGLEAGLERVSAVTKKIPDREPEALRPRADPVGAAGCDHDGRQTALPSIRGHSDVDTDGRGRRLRTLWSTLMRRGRSQ